LFQKGQIFEPKVPGIADIVCHLLVEFIHKLYMDHCVAFYLKDNGTIIEVVHFMSSELLRSHGSEQDAHIEMT
jgi:hypothetical protein